MPDARKIVSSLGLPEHEAVRLIAAVTGASLADVRMGVELSAAEEEAVRALVDRRVMGEPLQYLEGSAPFGPLDLDVDPRVLIPRPETEGLFERAVAALEDVDEPVVVDVGTGSGALALGIASQRPDAHVIAIDVSEDALDVATANASRLGLDIELLKGSVYGPLAARLAGRVSVIVSNPPYVADGTLLPVEVEAHEPRVALFGGEDGLDVIRELVAGAAHWLRPGGWLLIEIGESQGAAVLRLVNSVGGDLAARVERDLAGWDRYVVTRYVPVVSAREGIEALHGGAVVGMPTDTVYGLAAPIDDPSAIRRLFEIKGRPLDKPIPVLVGSPEQARHIGELSPAASAAVDSHWPGGLTVVVPMIGQLPPGVGDGEARTIGLRMPDHPEAIEILRAAGPLAVTSANRSGEDPAADANEARTRLWDSVGVFVGGGGGGGLASTVIDFTTDDPRVLRAGPIRL